MEDNVGREDWRQSNPANDPEMRVNQDVLFQDSTISKETVVEGTRTTEVKTHSEGNTMTIRIAHEETSQVQLEEIDNELSRFENLG